MSLHAQRRIEATHRRPTTVPGQSTTYSSPVTLFVGYVEEGWFDQAEDFTSAPSAEFEIFINPDDDIADGDLLDFSGYRHEVQRLRRFPTGKRSDHALAVVRRKEVATV